MSRPSLNSNLTALARRAGELRFDDSPAALRLFNESNRSIGTFAPELGHNAQPERLRRDKNCYKVPQGFVVKQYLAGSQRTLGLFRNADEYYATRFADLCIVRFWKYRRTKVPIINDDLNYSLEIAESALASCPEAVTILDSIELFLQQRFQINARPVTKTVQSLLPTKRQVEYWIQEKRPGDNWIDYCPGSLQNCEARIAELKIEKPCRTFRTIVRTITEEETVPVAPTTTATPNPDSVPITTTGGDATISPLFST